MTEFLKKITFKHVSILLLFVVFIYLLFRDKNENLETKCLYKKCKKDDENNKCCEGFVCHQNECIQSDSINKKYVDPQYTTYLHNTVKDLSYTYDPTPKVEDSETTPKVEDSEMDSEIKFDSTDSINLPKNMSCTCKRNNLNIPITSSKRMGDSCTINNECLSGKCLNNTCAYKLDGEDCVNATQCVSQTCDSSTKKCVGKDIGVKCVFGNQCESGICSSKVNCNSDISGDCDPICLNF
jgi:hypothetical protein